MSGGAARRGASRGWRAAERLRDREQAGSGRPVCAGLILLDLLEGDADGVAEIGLRKLFAKPLLADVPADRPVNGVGISGAHDRAVMAGHPDCLVVVD